MRSPFGVSTRAEIAEDRSDGHPQPADTGLSKALVRVECDALKPIMMDLHESSPGCVASLARLGQGASTNQDKAPRVHPHFRVWSPLGALCCD